AISGPREHVAGLAVALADAGALIRVPQTEARMLEEADRNLDGAVGARQNVAVRDELRQLLADRGTNLVVVPEPVAGAAREEVVPVPIRSGALYEIGRPGLHRPFLLAATPETTG